MNDEGEIEIILNCPECATPIIDIVKFGEYIECPNPDCIFGMKVIVSTRS